MTRWRRRLTPSERVELAQLERRMNELDKRLTELRALRRRIQQRCYARGKR